MVASWKQFFSSLWGKPSSSPYCQLIHKHEQQHDYHDSDSVASSTSCAADEEGLLTHRHQSQTTKEPSRAASRWWPLRSLLLHLVILAAYTAIYLVLLRRGYLAAQSLRDHHHNIYSPAHAAVVKESAEYQGQNMSVLSPYQGPPSPALDLAWKELLQHSNLRVTGADLARVNKTSIPMPGEDDGYWVELGVFHELHCIKRLRQYWHSDYYFPNITAEERRLNWIHNDHCLEILRSSVMCHADVSMITMFWRDDTIFPAADISNAHECTNWDTLSEWVQERSVDMMKPGFLVHPTLGAPFPDGQYYGIGVSDSNHAIGHPKASAPTT